MPIITDICVAIGALTVAFGPLLRRRRIRVRLDIDVAAERDRE